MQLILITVPPVGPSLEVQPQWSRHVNVNEQRSSSVCVFLSEPEAQFSSVKLQMVRFWFWFWSVSGTSEETWNVKYAQLQSCSYKQNIWRHVDELAAAPAS